MQAAYRGAGVSTPIDPEVSSRWSPRQGAHESARPPGDLLAWSRRGYGRCHSQCDRCQRELPSQPRETMLQHEPAVRPFQVLDMDFAHHAAGKYLVVVDGYSGWKFVECTGATANTRRVIEVMLKIFRDVGIPTIIRTDGAILFTSYQFQKFLSGWSIEHRTSSPHYHRSNELAESAVKSAKKLLRRC